MNEEKKRVTMHIPRKPGEQIEVDWSGDPAHIIDPDTGEITDAFIFVGVLTYSQHAFVEAFINEKTKAWIVAHVHMYEYFNGINFDSCTGQLRHCCKPSAKRLVYACTQSDLPRNGRTL